jgi:hypothetical protein
MVILFFMEELRELLRRLRKYDLLVELQPDEREVAFL